jgi:hypothetical protein
MGTMEVMVVGMVVEMAEEMVEEMAEGGISEHSHLKERLDPRSVMDMG